MGKIEKNLLKELENINNINKKILIAPAVFSDPLTSNLHSLIGVALKLKGADVDYLI